MSRGGGRGGWHDSARGTLVVRGVRGIAGVVVGVTRQVRLQLSRPEEKQIDELYISVLM